MINFEAFFFTLGHPNALDTSASSYTNPYRLVNVNHEIAHTDVEST